LIALINNGEDVMIGFHESKIKAIENALGYSFRDKDLLMQALIHSSLENNISNERLEFLGDRVLGLVIANHLFNSFDEPEGKLAKRLNAMVRRETCAEVAIQLGLGKVMVMAYSEEESGGRQKLAILADACEAVIAAIYLDSDFNVIERLILKWWRDFLAFPLPIDDAKSSLQEWSQARSLGLPDYEVLERSGPDHAPIFVVRVTIKNYGSAEATGSSKKQAQHEAARILLEYVIKNV
jgi:ribonuclease-3